MSRDNLACAICGSEIQLKRVGRPPRYCSSSCKDKGRPPEQKAKRLVASLKAIRDWADKNKELLPTVRDNWRKANPDKTARYTNSWRSRNTERVKSVAAEYSKKNRDHMNQRKREKRAANPGSHLKWVKENPEKVRLNARAGNHRRRACKANNGGTYTAKEWLELLEFYGGKCLCCGASDVVISADHVIPISKGGVNSIENLQPLCVSCNCKKSDKTIDYRPFLYKAAA